MFYDVINDSFYKFLFQILYFYIYEKILSIFFLTVSINPLICPKNRIIIPITEVYELKKY